MNIFERGFFNKKAEVPEEKKEEQEIEKNENPLENKELIQSLMIKKLESMLDALKEKKGSGMQCKIIGENVLNVKINMVRNFIEKVKSGGFVDLVSAKKFAQYAQDVDVRYLDDEKKIRTPERPDKSYSTRVVGA